MFKNIRKIAGIAAIAVAVSTVLAVPAGAGPAVPLGSPAGGWRPVVVSDTGWTAIPDFYIDVHQICGALLDIVPDQTFVNTRVTRTVTFRNGDTLTTAKGTEHILFADFDGAEPGYPGYVPVPMAISGTVTRLQLASGAIIVNKQGTGLLLAMNSKDYDTGKPDQSSTAEGRAYDRAHIENFSVFSSGSLTEYINAQNTDATVITKPAHTTSICKLMGFGKNRPVGALVGDYSASGL